MTNIRVVLVSPLQSGNVGSVCRAMANMDVSDLWVVAPRIADNAWEDGEKMACHAGAILEARHTVATLAETAKANGITKTALIVVGRVLGEIDTRSKLYDPAFGTEFREKSV